MRRTWKQGIQMYQDVKCRLKCTFLGARCCCGNKQISICVLNTASNEKSAVGNQLCTFELFQALKYRNISTIRNIFSPLQYICSMVVPWAVRGNWLSPAWAGTQVLHIRLILHCDYLHIWTVVFLDCPYLI